MGTTVYCIATSHAQAVRIANRLRSSGFTPDDISMLYPDRDGVRELGVHNATKAPEGATTGASAGALVGGALGWLVGIGAIAIPGVGPLVAAGPILALLSGLAVGGTVGGLSGALVGAGIPEYEAQQYEGRLRGGHILMAVHADNAEEGSQIRDIFSEEKAEDISSSAEASADRVQATHSYP
jgi:hypothetical protein